MTNSGLGDMARFFAASRSNLDIRSRLDGLARELSTGLRLDPARSLAGDSGRVVEVATRLEVIGRQTVSARQIADRLGVMQSSLGNIAGIGSGLLADLATLSQSAGNEWRKDAARLGEAAIADIVSTLNVRLAGTSLFSGLAEDQPALAPADVILSDIRSAISGSVTAGDVIAAIDQWIDLPGGGFETTAYLGDLGAEPVRRIDDLTSIGVPARADDPSIRQLLKGAALAAIADDASLALSDIEREALLSRATDELIGASRPLAELRGRLGRSEESVEGALTRLVAEEGALDLMRSNLLASDPFDVAVRLEEVQLQLETHYAVTARLSQLSLTRYL